jgi:hypothetical protein
MAVLLRAESRKLRLRVGQLLMLSDRIFCGMPLCV